MLAGLRAVLGLVAIPLAPLLWDDHFVVLVLLRPTKEVLLAGGFQLREGNIGLVEMVAAAIPLALFGVWLFFLVGRAFRKEIQSDEALPGWAGRIVPPKRIKSLCQVLDQKGRWVVVLGRLAAFPSTLLAAAAGASGMSPGSFMVADGLGGLLSIAEVVGAGYVLGEAYDDAGPWITGVGVAVLLGLLFLVGRWLRRVGKSQG